MIVAAPSLSLGRIPGRGAPPIPFAPTDLPDLELWLDAGEGVINTLGNNFTDANRTITVSGFPTTPEGATIGGSNQSPTGLVNGRNRYNVSVGGNLDGGLGTLSWNGTQWQIEAVVFAGDNTNYYYYYGVGDTTYPWQATWADGTVSPTATTFDIPATNDQSVALWVNKVSGKPNLNQPTLASQPVFKSNVFGRKAVFFNGDALHNSNFSTFGQEYSYYLVSTSLLGSTTTAVNPAIRIGTATGGFSRGFFGANSTSLAVQNATTIKATTLSRTVTNSSAVFSARFNLSSGIANVGRNLSFQQTTGNATSSASNTTILIGAANTSGSTAPINSNFSEVLVYRATHDETTANQIINYLVQKWNIDTNL